MTSLIDLNGLSLAEIEALMDGDDALAEAVRRLIEEAEDPDNPACKFNSAI